MTEEQQRVEELSKKLADMEAAAQSVLCDLTSEDAQEIRRIQRILELRKLRNMLDNWDELLAADHADRIGRIEEKQRNFATREETAEYRTEWLGLLRRTVEANERQTSAIERLAEILAVRGEGR